MVLRLVAHPWLLARLFHLFSHGELPLVSTVDMCIVLGCQTFLIVFNFGLLQVSLPRTPSHSLPLTPSLSLPLARSLARSRRR